VRVIVGAINEIIDHINRLEKTLRPCTCGDKDE
jgi:hypothetical protein